MGRLSHKTVLSFSLPESETFLESYLDEGHKAFLPDDILEDTKEILGRAQYRTRLRVEPILAEMKEYLDSFDVPES